MDSPTTPGLPVRLAGIVLDRTDQRITEDSLRQAQKMEAIGQLTREAALPNGEDG